MGKYFFYCKNEHCLEWFLGTSGRVPIDKVAQELDGRKLCQSCYDAGYRLKLGVIVIKRRS